MGEGDCGALQARLLLSHQARLLPRQACLARFLQARFHQARVLGEAAAALRAEGGAEVRRCGGAEVYTEARGCAEGERWVWSVEARPCERCAGAS